MKRYSVPLLVTGIVLSSAGVVMILAGSAVYSNPDTYRCTCVTTPCDCGGEPDNTAGTVLLVAGAIAAAGGIPLIVIGARKVPVEPETKVETTALLPELGIGPASASLRWSF
jgi:hypothetical protein